MVNKMIYGFVFQSWHNAVYATVVAALGENKINALSFGLRTFLLDLQPDTMPAALEGKFMCFSKASRKLKIVFNSNLQPIK